MNAKAPGSGVYAGARGAGLPSRGASQRRLRVAEELRHRLAEILQRGECRDPALRDAGITVTEVRISPDFRNATVYVMPLGGANRAEIVAALTRGAGFLRRQIARGLVLRYVPNLTFALDETFDEADRITAVLGRPEVVRDLQTSPADGEAGDDAE
jgi:ribosome-binding factor A